MGSKLRSIYVIAAALATVAIIVALAHAGHRPLARAGPPATSLMTSLTASNAGAETADCGPRALLIVCYHLGIPARIEILRKYAGTTARGTTLLGLQKAAEAYGLHATGVQVTGAAISQVTGPAVAWFDGDHYVALLATHGGQAIIHDPNKRREEVISTDDLLRRSDGYMLLIGR
jgi:ABC-type bacteriocin/lantibiotic exporter with double-glycine peptidase domain